MDCWIAAQKYARLDKSHHKFATRNLHAILVVKFLESIAFFSFFQKKSFTPILRFNQCSRSMTVSTNRNYSPYSPERTKCCVKLLFFFHSCDRNQRKWMGFTYIDTYFFLSGELKKKKLVFSTGFLIMTKMCRFVLLFFM